MSLPKVNSDNMRLINTIFQTRMFLVVLTLLLSYIFVFAPTGFNRTIMWGLIDQLNHYIEIYFPFILIFYLLSYGIVFLAKKKTNKNVSILHAITIFASMLLLKSQGNLFFLLTILSFALFLANMILSLKKE